MAILFGKKIDYKIHRKILDKNGNFIIPDLTVHNQNSTLVNIYGPNNDNPNFFQKHSNCLDEIGNNEAIICWVITVV